MVSGLGFFFFFFFTGFQFLFFLLEFVEVVAAVDVEVVAAVDVAVAAVVTVGCSGSYDGDFFFWIFGKEKYWIA